MPGPNTNHASKMRRSHASGEQLRSFPRTARVPISRVCDTNLPGINDKNGGGAMGTIANTITHGITLATSGTYASPLTITSTGAVLNTSGVGIYGPNTQTWTVANFGTVMGGTGVFLADGGVISNGATAALISGGLDGVKSTGAAIILSNAGTIVATNSNGIGVALYSGGTIANGVRALISGNNAGIWMGSGASGTVSNLGTIAAASPSGVGIVLDAGGLVVNGTVGFPGGYISGSLAGVEGGATIINLATIKGGVGVSTGDGATVANAGTIAGTSGTALSMVASLFGTSRLILAPGAVFQGIADGGAGTSFVHSVVDVVPSLAGLGAVGTGETAAATVYVSLGSVTNFSALEIGPGATANAGGSISFRTLANQGQINIAAGDSLVVGEVIGGPGTIDLRSGGIVHVTGAVESNETVLFGPPGGTVTLDHPEQFGGTVSQFAAGDTIDLPLGSAKFVQYAGGILSFLYGPFYGGGGLIAWQLSTTAVTPQFQFTRDGQGTDIFVSDVCFCRGTAILTERGEVAVEDLAVGDRVVTLSGALKPIAWIGFGRNLVTRANKLARPVIVRAGALAEGVPYRDLYLTHGHALYLDGVLIPVENLVNHRSILWDEAARVVEYYHIELEDHDVVLANGAPAESYYDASNRAFFQNTRPGSAPGEAKPTFAPVLNGGEVVEQVWARLFRRSGGRRFAAETTDDPDLHLIANGRRLDPSTIEGWAYTFALSQPPETSLHLCSRSGVPSLLGITAHDHRRLGIAIRGIVISQPSIETVVAHDSLVLLAAGCHPAEAGYCWTDGELTLPAPLFAHLSGAFTLSVQTERPGMRYPLAAVAAEAA